MATGWSILGLSRANVAPKLQTGLRMRVDDYYDQFPPLSGVEDFSQECLAFIPPKVR